jgi:phosphohistidine phosphatase SixA
MHRALQSCVLAAFLFAPIGVALAGPPDLAAPLLPASGLSAVVTDGQVRLSWHNPADGHFAAVRVLRTLNRPPTGADDPAATVIYEGPSEAASEPADALLPSTRETPRVYTYSVYPCDRGGRCAAAGSRATVQRTLMQALQAGGYVLYFRHAAADVCVDRKDLGSAAASASPWWKSCDSNCATATARQLSHTGVAQATAIGQALRQRGVRFDRVLVSEFCRARQSAQAMALGPAPQASPDLTQMVYDESRRCARTMALLAQAPAAGRNTALISHAGSHCPPLDDLASGEAAVYRPDGKGGTVLIDRVTWDAWPTLP